MYPGRQELGEAKIKRDEVQNKRKDLWRQDSNFEQSLNTSKEQLDEAERQLRSTVSKVGSSYIVLHIALPITIHTASGVCWYW